MPILIRCLLLVVLLVTPLSGQEPQRPRMSTVEEFAEDFKSVPCKNKERLAAVQALFEKMTAKPSDISIQKKGDAANLVLKKTGGTEDVVVIGAHYDLVEEGCGAVDNWSGIVAVAHLFRTISPMPTEKTILFVAFDDEEKGLIGSEAMANAIPKNDVPRYCAMVNIDSFGLAQPFALEHTSSPKLLNLATEAAEVLKIPFVKVGIPGTNADSSSFRARKIPAVTLSGLSDLWSTILHTRQDQVDRVEPLSVYLGYRLALLMWNRIDQAPCDAYR